MTAVYRPKTDPAHANTDCSPALAPLIAGALIVAFQFAIFAAEKPGEYARFALIIDVTLALLASVATARLSSHSARWAVAIALLVGTAAPASFYMLGFAKDSRATTSRDLLASQIRLTNKESLTTIGLPDEPAPYLMPPVDLWKWQLILLPKNFDFYSPPDVAYFLRPVDGRDDHNTIGNYRRSGETSPKIISTPISWADKTIELWQYVESDPRPHQWMNRMSPKFGASGGAIESGRKPAGQ